jgi:hypothetical protein
MIINFLNRILTNILGKLKIRCIYDKNGCKEILSLDNLNNHEISCLFDKRTCEKCFCELSVNHDCIKSLLEAKKKVDEKINDLQIELKLAKEEISSLKSEKEKYLQTIQDISNANEVFF